MITTNTITLGFSGDGLTNTFDVQIEGIPQSPDGAKHFVVSRKDASGKLKVLLYGMDYSYEAQVKYIGGVEFSQSITIRLSNPLPKDESIYVLRTTPVFSISEYPTNKTPPKQVEADIDNIIKILQEMGYAISSLKEAIDLERKERIEADENLQEQINNKVDKLDGIPKHNWTHFKNGDDPITPNDIGALEQAPSTGRPYLVSTSNGVTVWVEYFEALGEMSATTVCQHFQFTGEGITTEWDIPHSLKTLSVSAIVYDVATGKRVYFPSFVKDENTVTLKSKIAMPGRSFRGIIQGAGRIDPVYFQGQIQIDVGTPSTEWHLVHHLHNRKPNIRIFNSDETQISGFSVDWANATPDEISVFFANPKSGFAILDGWVNTAPESFVPPTYTHIQNTPSEVWHIGHYLNVTRPTLIILDQTETQVFPQIDYENATLDSIDLIFPGNPTMGTAVVKA